MNDSDMETQTFDTQSGNHDGFSKLQFSSPSPVSLISDHILNVWIGNETEPFGDTVPLGSPCEETQLENIGSCNEVLDVTDFVNDIATQMVDDYEEEVVLDSDDERVHQNETMCSTELTSGELKRTAGGDVVGTPCVNSKDFVLGSVASGNKKFLAVYKRRRVNLVRAQTIQGAGLGRGIMSDKVSSIGPNSAHSDACSQKKFVIKCEAVCEKDSTLLTSDEAAKLGYNEFEEPRESSQVNALAFVDQYLSFNKTNLPEEFSPKKTSRQKSPPVSCAKGIHILARRALLGTTCGMSRTFEWDANVIEDGEDDPLKQRKDSILNGKGSDSTSVTRCPSDKILNVQSQTNLRDQSKKKFQGETLVADFSNSSLLVLDSVEVGNVLQVSGVKFVKEMDDQLNAETSEQQLEAGGLGRDLPDTFDVGFFDTQMAAEAMEALFYAPPPNPNINSTPQDPENTVEDSSESSTRKCSFYECCSNSGVAEIFLKQNTKPSRMLSEKIVASSRKNKRSRKKLDPELPAYKMRGKSLGENHFHSRNPSNANKRARKSSFRLIEQGKVEKVKLRDIKKVNLVSSISVKRNSLEERSMQGKRGISSALARKTRSWSSVHPQEDAEDPTESFEQSLSDVIESGVLRKRRKNDQNADTFNVSSLGGKRPKIGLHMSDEAKDIKESQHAENELDVAPDGSHLKFTKWSYPRRKRTPRNVPCNSKGKKDSMDIHIMSQLNSETTYSTESHKKSRGNSITNCFKFYVRRKKRSPACAHQIQPSPSKKCKEKSGEQDHVVFVSSADGANERNELDVLSNGNADLCLSKCLSPVNFTEGIDLAPAVLNGNEKGRHWVNRKLSRFPLTKELIRLGFSEPLTSTKSKDLRRRRHMTSVRVLFSHNLDDDVVKQQEKILARLGSSLASSCSDATHFVTDRFVRTRNMLESIAFGKPVVTQLWLDSCGQASCFISEKNYILRDAKKEKEIGFSMPVSLAHARQYPLLKQGRRVIVTSNIKPSKELIVSLVKAVHGQVVDRIQEAAMPNERISEDILILSCEQDYELCAPFLDKGAAVFSSELLLNGIVIQKLEFERHQLFKTISRCLPASVW